MWASVKAWPAVYFAGEPAGSARRWFLFRPTRDIRWLVTNSVRAGTTGTDSSPSSSHPRPTRPLENEPIKNRAAPTSEFSRWRRPGSCSLVVLGVETVVRRRHVAGDPDGSHRLGAVRGRPSGRPPRGRRGRRRRRGTRLLGRGDGLASGAEGLARGGTRRLFGRRLGSDGFR